MLTFRLFGADLELSEGSNTVGMLGPFNVQATITLKSAQKSLAIVLKGDVCGVTMDLAWRGTIHVSGAIVILLATPAPTTTLSASLKLPDATTLTLAAPLLQVATDVSRGLDIVDRNGAAFDWLRPALSPGLSFDVASKATIVELDVRRTTTRYRPATPAGPILQWKDYFQHRITPPAGFGPTQLLAIDALDIGARGYELQARPLSGALFLHGDILDTSSVSDIDNQFLFQYAIANGRLIVGGPDVTHVGAMTWAALPNVAEGPLVLLLRLQDEHGYPVALIADAAVPLGTRQGVKRTVKTNSDIVAWVSTNQTNAIAPAIGTSGVMRVSGQLAALSAKNLYAAFADRTVAKNSLTNPWFVQNGVVPLDTGIPREIHGLSRGVRLQSRSVSPAVEQTKATLVVEPELVDGLSLFHHTHLELYEAGHWDIVALREERDLKPGDALPPWTPQPVGVHRSKGISGQGVFALPAIDLPFALANLGGLDRINNKGLRLGNSALPTAGHRHLDLHEKRLATVFEPPQVPPQRHVDGARAVPADAQPFARLLDRLPTAANAAQTGRIGPELSGKAARMTALLAGEVATNTTRLLFGGEDGVVSDVAGHLERQANNAKSAGEQAFRTFQLAWRGHAADADLMALRKTFGIPERPTSLGADLAPKFLAAAIDYLRTSDNASDIIDDEDDAQALGDYLADVSPEEFADEWANPDPRLALLLEHVWSPADYDLMRRIVRFPGAGALTQKLFGLPGLDDLKKFLDDPAGGMLPGVVQGVDELWEKVVEIYEHGVEATLVALRDRYGPHLTHDVYARLLEAAAAADAERLLAVLKTYLPQALRRLGDLSADPPEYVLRTQRFAVAQSGRDTLVDAMWQQCFDLCAFATEKVWTFFLDQNTTVLVKLSRKRTLSDILQEVVRTYAGADRPDPLGIRPYTAPGDAPLTTDEIVNRFIDDLDADLKDPGWIGVLLLRPVADIHQDEVLRDLAGFDHITASYIAVGGRRPAVAAPKNPALDVWAHIFQQNPNGEDLPKDPGTIGDVKLALTKFDVRIRQTQLSTADIEVEIYPQDVWGKRPPPPSAIPTTPAPPKPFPTLTLHGNLQAPAGDPSGPKDLVFSAFFPKPFTLDIDLTFVKELELSRLSVARRNGCTSIDIDGQLQLQKPQGLDLALDLAENDLRLDLQNFRIQIPTLPGVKVEVGARRRLAFDLPAVRFALPKPRAFNLFGVELVPTGLGYIRGNEPDALTKFSNEYLWLKRLEITNSPNVFVSYMEFAVDFGKSPSFGMIDARGLRFNMALAAKVENNAATAAYLGISGLDAKDLKLSIFGFLTLEVKELRISPAQLLKGTEAPASSKVNAGAILAEDLKLRIFNWSPTPAGSKLDLLMLHPTRDPGGSPEDNRRKGLLAYYDSRGKPSSGSFFELYWMVLAHNMELPAKALNYLLEQNPGAVDPGGLLEKLLEKPDETLPKPRTSLVLRDVALMDRESWLFGLSFKLGVLFERCSFVLHDQHYYGIRLWAQWVKAVFKQESIELAYIPGHTRSEDRFRTNLRIPGLDMLGSLKSGEFALEWGVNWDFMIDVGFPWRTSIGYDWFRSFSVPVGCYEGKFGFYIEKKTIVVHDDKRITLAIGMGVYVGYYFGAGNSVAWVRAGIGVFAILEGRITLQAPANGGDLGLLKSSIYSIEIVGVIGVLAYGEGGIDVWILSASFRVSAQVAVSCTISYVAGGPSALSYSAVMAAGYSASVRVGCGFCSWTFSVSGEVSMGVSGQLLLS